MALNVEVISSSSEADIYFIIGWGYFFRYRFQKGMNAAGGKSERFYQTKKQCIDEIKKRKEEFYESLRCRRTRDHEKKER